MVASEVMAIFCLASSLEDLRNRLGNVVGVTRDQEPVRARDLEAHGAMTVLLKDALKPNLVQTLENNPAIIHGGPFANIAHGCNSVIATRSAPAGGLRGDRPGADLGAEKFVDIKAAAGCARAPPWWWPPSARSSITGAWNLPAPQRRNLEASNTGWPIWKGTRNVRDHFGLPCIVAINRITQDTPAEHRLVQDRMKALGVPASSLPVTGPKAGRARKNSRARST